MFCAAKKHLLTVSFTRCGCGVVGRWLLVYYVWMWSVGRWVLVVGLDLDLVLDTLFEHRASCICVKVYRIVFLGFRKYIGFSLFFCHVSSHYVAVKAQKYNSKSC